MNEDHLVLPGGKSMCELLSVRLGVQVRKSIVK